MAISIVPNAAVRRNWLAFVVRGVVAVLFGVLIIMTLNVAFAAFILVLGIYFVVDGIFAVAGALLSATPKIVPFSSVPPNMGGRSRRAAQAANTHE